MSGREEPSASEAPQPARGPWRMSVRAQLNYLVAATITLVLLAFLVPLGLVLRNSAEDRADAAASLRAQAAASLVALGQDPPDPIDPQQPQVTVFYGDGREVGAPAIRTPSIALAARGRAFSAVSGNGIEVLVPVQGLPTGTAVVRSYASGAVRHAGVARTWTVLGGLGAVLLVVGVMLADRLGRRLTGSVTDLAATADRLATGDLTARVRPSKSPELGRVGQELNRLAGRIQGLLTKAREDAADLAHRLRTPVTALRLDVDSVRDPEDRARLSADVDALNRLVDEVIRTARRPVREGAGAATDLVEVVAERVAFWQALAEETGRPVLSHLPNDRIRVRSSRDDLVAAVDALLGNVFSHTPDDATVRIEVRPHRGGGARLTVEDAGPGFATAAHVAGARGVSTGGSTGLGLDIARRTAEAGGGALYLGTGSLGGARVDLVFGDPETPDGPDIVAAPAIVVAPAIAAPAAVPDVVPGPAPPVRGTGEDRPPRRIPTPVPRATRRLR